jgi:hypothetical protein
VGESEAGESLALFAKSQAGAEPNLAARDCDLQKIVSLVHGFENRLKPAHPPDERGGQEAPPTVMVVPGVLRSDKRFSRFHSAEEFPTENS